VKDKEETTQHIVTVDGKVYAVDDARNFLELCLRNDIRIPHLCNREGLSVEAMCGLCFVEQKIQKKWVPVLACALVPQSGIEIRTQSKNIDALRQLSAMNLLRIHRVRCYNCREDGKCFLQKVYHQIPSGLTPELTPEEILNPKIVALGKNTLCIDRQKCIGCGLCVRYVQEVLGEDWLSIETLEHGFRRIDIYPGVYIPPGKNAPLIELCPVHALSDNRKRRIKVYHDHKIDHGISIVADNIPRGDLWHQRHQLIMGPAKRDDTPFELQDQKVRKEWSRSSDQKKGRILCPLAHGERIDTTSWLFQVLSAISASRSLGIVISRNLCLEDLLLISRWCGYRKPGKIFFLEDVSPKERRYPSYYTMSDRIFSSFILGGEEAVTKNISKINQDIEAQKIDALWLFQDTLPAGLDKKMLCLVPTIYMGPSVNATGELCDFVLPTMSSDERSGWILGTDYILRAFQAEKMAPENVYEEWKWIAMMINLYCDFDREDQKKYMTRADLWRELQIQYPALRTISHDALPSEGISLKENISSLGRNKSP
jgi:NAD-dependent dihydropyrimidine dehydrogenase PreA subunit